MGIALAGPDRGEHCDDRGQIFVGRLTTQNREDRLGTRRSGVGGHRGMFPCLRGGKVARLVRRARNAVVTRARVSEGRMTSST